MIYYDTDVVKVKHEIMDLLDYDHEPCVDDDMYRYDQCKQNYIFKVCTITINRPSLGLSYLA